MGYNLLPAAPLNIPIQNRYKSIKGSGPDALPPNVLSLAPAGLTSSTSNSTMAIGTSIAFLSYHPVSILCGLRTMTCANYRLCEFASKS